MKTESHNLPLEACPVELGDWVQSRLNPSHFGRVFAIGTIGKGTTYAFHISQDGGETLILTAGDFRVVSLADIPNPVRLDQPHPLDSQYVSGATEKAA